MMRLLMPLLVAATVSFPIEATSSPLWVEAYLEEKVIHAVLDGERIGSWNIAVGTEEHPTPTGQFRIRKMIWNPGWVPPAKEWARDAEAKKPGDPDNPMRVVKIFFKPPDYYIHGTNQPETIGTAASHGCIRMTEQDVFELGRMIMEHGGETRNASWFRRIFTSDTSDTVYLETPVRMQVMRSPE